MTCGQFRALPVLTLPEFGKLFFLRFAPLGLQAFEVIDGIGALLDS